MASSLAIPGPRKRRSTDTHVTADVSEELLSAVARLSLSTAASVRALHGIAIRTVLVPASSPIIQLGKSASAAWATQSQSANRTSPVRDPPFYSVFLAMVDALAKAPLCHQYPQDVQTSILAAANTEILHQHLRACRISRCFDRQFVRVELAATGPLEKAASLLISTLIHDGGRECFGSAPRGPLERSISNLVGRISS